MTVLQFRVDMSGFLVQVNYTDNAIARTTVLGMDNGMFASAVGAITAAKNLATAVATSKGQVPINVTATVNLTR